MSEDYARIWRRLKPAERDRRITIALNRAAAGEPLYQIARTWQISAPSLCRALIAYAPTEWRNCLVARALVRYDEAVAQYAVAPGNIPRARVNLTMRHLDHSLRVAGLALDRKGKIGSATGPCKDCAAGTTWVTGKSARCISCGTERPTLDYLSTLQPSDTTT